MKYLSYKEFKKSVARRNKEIVKLRKKGNTVQGIGKVFGLSKQTISKILIREGQGVATIDKR